MKRVLKWAAVVGLMLSLSSCGLIGASARSAGRLGKSLGGLLGPAAAAAAL